MLGLRRKRTNLHEKYDHPDGEDISPTSPHVDPGRPIQVGTLSPRLPSRLGQMAAPAVHEP